MDARTTARQLRRRSDRRALYAVARASAGLVAVRRATDEEFVITLRQRHLVAPGQFAAVASLIISLPAGYPEARPLVRFAGTPPFHPNIYPNGVVCVNFYRPAMTIETVLATVVAFLAARDMNPDSPANTAALEYYRRERDTLHRELVPVALTTDDIDAGRVQVVRRA